MKTMTVEDSLYGALEQAADRNGRSVQSCCTRLSSHGCRMPRWMMATTPRSRDPGPKPPSRAE